jgi:hypothetical protein
MTIRPFDWRDLPNLHRYRNQCLFLDSTRLLTHGPQLIPVRMLFSYFALSSGILMYQSSANNRHKHALLGQVIHSQGKSCARLSFVTPAFALEEGSLTGLVEHVVKDLGERGATHLLAEVDEQTEAFEALRKAGFATYSRQRIWQLNGLPQGQELETHWKVLSDLDIISVRALYANLVPGLVQQVEQPGSHRPRGMVFRNEEDIQGYVELKYGPKGIMMQPFIHPDVEDVSARLVSLINNLPYRRSRPVYLCVRSYQSWLEQAIENLGAEVGPRQAVMVRHLAIRQTNARSYVLPALKRGHPEVSAPITRRIIKKL